LTNSFLQETAGGTIAVLAQDGSNEGGEVKLNGAGSYTEWILDNYQGHFRLHHGGYEYLRFTADGMLGIGVTAPSTVLHVHGGDNTNYGQLKIESSGADARLSLYNSNGATSTGRGDILMSRASGYEGLRFMINNSDKMIVSEDGHVGIGTTNPTYRLQVNGTFRVNDSGDGDTSPFLVHSSGNVGIGMTPSYPLHVNGSAYFAGALTVGTTLSIDGGTLTVQPANNSVGIGVTNPGTGAKLHVDGDVYIDGDRKGLILETKYRLAVTKLGYLVANCIDETCGEDSVWEGALFGVDRYAKEGSGVCCATCDDTDHAADAVDSAYDALVNIGYNSDRVRKNKNAGVDGRDWLDMAVRPWGADAVAPYGTDFADVVFYSGHGQADCSDQYGVYASSITMGAADVIPDPYTQNTETCAPDFESEIRFGNSGGGEEANVLVMLSCQTLQYCVATNGVFDSVVHGRFNTIVGFHGDADDSSTNVDKVGVYIVSAEWNGIGDDWIDIMNYSPLFGNQHCGTVLIYGANETECDDQFDYGGYKDFHDTGQLSGSTYYWIQGCDPLGGPELP
jgi:hypothetical protein